MNYLLFIALLLMAFTSGCEKPIIQEKPYYDMDPEFKNTFLQGWEGSYWIYSDSLGNIHDTVTLVHAGKGIGYVHGDYHAEEYSTRYEATNCKDFFTLLTTIPILWEGKQEIYYQFDFNVSTGNEFRVTLRDGKYESFREGGIQKIDSINVSGEIYYNVIKLNYGSLYPTVIIDPKIGIIYKEAWSLRPTPGVKSFYLKDYNLK